MLSERARHQWTAFAMARLAATAAFGDRDELHRFLVGLHLRGELLSAAELAGLLDEAGLTGADRDDLVTLIESGLALLTSYDRMRGAEERAYAEEEEEHGGFLL